MSTTNDRLRNPALLGAFAFAILGTAYWLHHSPSATVETPPPMQLEVGKQFKVNSTFACDSKTGLQEMVGYAKAHDREKFAAAFQSGTCTHIDDQTTYQVVQLDADSAEFVPVNVDTPKHRWLMRDTVKQVL